MVEWLIRRDAAAVARPMLERMDGSRNAGLQPCQIFELGRIPTADCESVWIPKTAAPTMIRSCGTGRRVSRDPL